VRARALAAAFLLVPSLACRDRAFQNGDGFHLVLALPRADGAPSTDFTVVAVSAVDRPAMEWTRRAAWYRGPDRVFVPLSPAAQAATAARDGRIGLELLLPWSDVAPLHPWLSPAVGLNLAVVRAVGEREKNVHLLVPDRYVDSEGKPRLSVLPRLDRVAVAARLSRAAPAIPEGTRATIEYLASEAEASLRDLPAYEPAGRERLALEGAAALLSRAEAGEDPIAGRNGPYRRAFRSRRDGTLQPYALRVPRSAAGAVKRPVLVWLHGSGSDERALFTAPD
jgi:hypothetical protein